jgi:protein-tyrosine-phosphatase
MAEGLLARMLHDAPVRVASAGTDAPEGAPPTPQAVDVAMETGADIRGHRATRMTAEMVHRADLILVMERYHRERVLELDPEAGPKTRLLASFGGGPDKEIEDPIGRSVEFYRKTARTMADRLALVAASLRTRVSGRSSDCAHQRRT